MSAVIEALGLLSKLPRNPKEKRLARIYRIENGVEVEIPARVPGRRYVSTSTGSREMSAQEQQEYEARQAAAIAAQAAQDAAPVPLTMEQRMFRIESEMAIVKARLGIP